MKMLKFKLKYWLLMFIIGDRMTVIFNAKISGGKVGRIDKDEYGIVHNCLMEKTEVEDEENE